VQTLVPVPPGPPRFAYPPPPPVVGLVSKALVLERTGLSDRSGKAIPIQAWTGPYGSRSLTLAEVLDSRHMKVVRLSALRTGRINPPGDIPGTHFCKRLSRPLVHTAAGSITSMKKSNAP